MKSIVYVLYFLGTISSAFCGSGDVIPVPGSPDPEIARALSLKPGEARAILSSEREQDILLHAFIAIAFAGDREDQQLLERSATSILKRDSDEHLDSALTALRNVHLLGINDVHILPTATVEVAAYLRSPEGHWLIEAIWIAKPNWGLNVISEIVYDESVDIEARYSAWRGLTEFDRKAALKALLTTDLVDMWRRDMGAPRTKAMIEAIMPEVSKNPTIQEKLGYR